MTQKNPFETLSKLVRELKQSAAPTGTSKCFVKVPGAEDLFRHVVSKPVAGTRKLGKLTRNR